MTYPLAELVKIDPKAIGIGQYQHDMPPARLDAALAGVVAKRVFGCAGRTRGLGSVAPHRGRSTQQPPAGRTTPATVYKCALVNKGLMACPRILAGLQSIPQPPEDGTGQSEML